jgi:hypothetical protein
MSPPVDVMQALVLVGGGSIALGVYSGRCEDGQPVGLRKLLYLLFRFPCYIPPVVYFVGFLIMTVAFAL